MLLWHRSNSRGLIFRTAQSNGTLKQGWPANAPKRNRSSDPCSASSVQQILPGVPVWMIEDHNWNNWRSTLLMLVKNETHSCWFFFDWCHFQSGVIPRQAEMFHSYLFQNSDKPVAIWIQQTQKAAIILHIDRVSHFSLTASCRLVWLPKCHLQ